MITFNALRLEIDDPQQKVWLSFLGPNGLTVDATFFVIFKHCDDIQSQSLVLPWFLVTIHPFVD